MPRNTLPSSLSLCRVRSMFGKLALDQKQLCGASLSQLNRTHYPTNYHTQQHHRPKTVCAFSNIKHSHPTLLKSSVDQPPTYSSPKSGILSYVPAAWVPYGELIRFDKPAGSFYLYLPCIWSTSLAASMAIPTIPPNQLLTTNLLLFIGSVMIRGAGCAWNDVLDRDIDRQVVRTRLRPIARGAVSPLAACTFVGFHLAIGTSLLSLLPEQCLYYGIPSIILGGLYPLAKRVTHYPQVVLGFVMSWGSLIGFPALGINVLSSSPTILMAAGCLYGASIAWIILADWIYARQDFQDDEKLGVRSIAVRHVQNTKAFFTGGSVATGFVCEYVSRLDATNFEKDSNV